MENEYCSIKVEKKKKTVSKLHLRQVCDTVFILRRKVDIEFS